MSFVNAWCRASEYRTAVGTDFIQPCPSGDMTKAFAAAHPREHPRPDLVQEKRLAIIIEMMPGWGVGRRIASQNMRALIVKIQTRRVNYHSVCGEIGLAIVNQAEL